MDLVVVAAAAQERWTLGAALGVPAEAAMDLVAARSWIAHPACPTPEVIVLSVHTDADVDWLAWHRSYSTRRSVPVITLVGDQARLAPTRAAGSDHVIHLDQSGDEVVAAVHAAIEDLSTAEADVIDLGTVVRTA